MTALITAPSKISLSALTPITVDEELEYLKKDFSECLIDNQNLRLTEFRFVDLSSTMFNRSELIYCAFLHNTMYNTTFSNCDLTGTRFYSPENCLLHFVNCQMTAVNLEELKKRQYILENCWAYSSLNEEDRKVIRL